MLARGIPHRCRGYSGGRKLTLVTAVHTGRLKLEKTTLAIGDANGKRVAVSIPAGEIVTVVANPSAENEEMVDVLCTFSHRGNYSFRLKSTRA
jgi:hypothetical protein